MVLRPGDMYGVGGVVWTPWELGQVYIPLSICYPPMCVCACVCMCVCVCVCVCVCA